MSYSAFSRLPSTVKDLSCTLDRYDPSFFACLPPGITKLDFNTVESTPQNDTHWRVEDVWNLPRTLRSFSLSTACFKDGFDTSKSTIGSGLLQELERTFPGARMSIGLVHNYLWKETHPPSLCVAVALEKHWRNLLETPPTITTKGQYAPPLCLELANVAPQLLRPILNLLDGASLARLVLCGDRSLNQRMMPLVTSFKHEYKLRYALEHQRRLQWPSIVSRFPNLEEFHLSSQIRITMVERIDILSLAPTLQSLKLNFDNAIFSLIDLPAVLQAASPHTPLLRKEIVKRFHRLKEIVVKPHYHAYNWDFWPFVQQLGSLDIALPDLDPRDFFFGPNRSYQLPPAIKELALTCGREHAELPFTIPTSVTSLYLQETYWIKDNLLKIVPWGSLKRLRMELPKWAVPMLSLAPNLEILEVDGNAAVSPKMVTSLPRTLRSLTIREYSLFAFETLAQLPPSLTVLNVYDASIVTEMDIPAGFSMEDFITMACESGEVGLPKNVFPSMREEIVMKLPRNLREMPWNLFIMIRPCDWDALPRTLHSFSILFKNDVPFSKVPLTSATAPHISALPRLINSFRIFNILEPTECRFDHRIHIESLELASTAPDGSYNKKGSRQQRFKGMMREIATHVRYIDMLEIDFGKMTFPFDGNLLFELNRTLVKRIRMTEDQFDQERTNKPNRIHAKRSVSNRHENVLPSCLSRLESLSMDDSVKSAEISSWLFSVIPVLPPTLTRLLLPKGTFDLPANLVSQLPLHLKELRCSLDRFDSNFFEHLPPALTMLIIHDRNEYPPSGNNWQLEDLWRLPRTLEHVRLPSEPFHRQTEEESGNFFDDTVLLELRKEYAALHIEVGEVVVYADPEDESDEPVRFDALIALELHWRTQKL